MPQWGGASPLTKLRGHNSAASRFHSQKWYSSWQGVNSCRGSSPKKQGIGRAAIVSLREPPQVVR
eukprot:9756464-Alexandrium_andersonii.AAC.1